ncbi:MAG: mechanosensitive ion channel family protein [Gemmatimonadetes bacterium]|nr:mechanosensitive ion channel family protein [Gemmatimonadota bacterium]
MSAHMLLATMLQQGGAAQQGFNLERLLAQGPAPFIRVGGLLLLGLPLAYAVSRWIRRYVTHLYNQQKGLIASKLVYYPLVTIILITVLSELGFRLAPLLGAAGILGVALGFASQTSVSNIISGFFLLAEEPFQVGDVITVGDVTGAVLTIDMLSVKIRTFDNKMVRIPNESLVKSQLTNVTRFPIRRVDINVGIAYKEDIAHVREVLLDVAEKNPNVLMEPEPLVIFSGYGQSSIDFLFAVWAKKESWLAVKNAITEEIKVRFDAEDIEIPFPHISIYAGSATDSIPVRLVQGMAEEKES